MGQNRFYWVAQAMPGDTGPLPDIDLCENGRPGLDRDLTYICIGEFVGIISIEGSGDRAAWGTMKSYSVQDLVEPDIEMATEGFVDISADKATVRYLRLNIKGRIISQTTVSVAGEEKCAGKT